MITTESFPYQYGSPSRGYLVLIGGNEDRSDDMMVLREVLKLAARKRVLVIPCASHYADEAWRDYRNAFERIGAERVQVLNPATRDDVDRPENFKLAEEADVIFFSGGDQVRLAHLFRDTQMLEVIRRRFESGAVVAGTSAGAHAAGNPMIYDGNRKGFSKGKVHSEPGFGLIDGICFDTHFLTRRRIARLTQFLSSRGCRHGIGLAEDTGIILAPDGTFRVIGSNVVTIIHNARMGYSNFDYIEPEQLITVEGLTLGFLAPGTVFDLQSWQVVRQSEAVQQHCG